MAKIRVTTGGCGITYKDENGIARHALKTAESGPFECDSAQAERLVRLGVAAYETAAGEDEGQEEPEAKETSGPRPNPDPETMDYNDLKKLAVDLNAEPKSQKKADLIAAIKAAMTRPGDETEDEDALPKLGAADPE